MRIGLDFDGVMSDCGKLKEIAAKEMFGAEIASDRFKWELVVGEGILTDGQYRLLQETIYGTREFGLRMEPVPGMLEFLPRLLAAGHEVSVITSRQGATLEVAREWLARHGLSLGIVGVGRETSKASAAAGMHVYLDDDLDKLQPLVGVVPNRFLFSWGYNGHVDAGGVAKRVGSWREFHDTVASLARETAAA